ncbi:MAG: AAA family ATPase [Bacillota bacterium]|nr:AAA family ATPase [Bacillota bacterium]
MKINNLEVKGFGKINNLKLNFKDSFNIVFGQNESGKTTLQWFIRGMLFGLKGGRSGKDGSLPPLKRFKPWKTNEYSGIMEYTLDTGKTYRVVRNFAGNQAIIYDSSFNELTDSFDTSKERGALFAEKHLGLNENCFDKTVLIRQLDARIDEEGSRELLNRLTNAVQTGFEDISYKRAQDALKEALKTYIGTDKTSTRPLDKIVSRLQELKSLKDEYSSKREELFHVEQQLNQSRNDKDLLEQKKALFEQTKEFIKIRKSIDQVSRKISEITEILDNIHQIHTEMDILKKRADEINVSETELSRFSVFDNEDIDKITTDFNTYLYLIEDVRKQETGLRSKEMELEVILASVKHLNAFENTTPGVDNEVIKLYRDLESLKSEKENYNPDNFNTQIGSENKRKNRFNLAAFLSLATAILSLSLGLLAKKGGFAGMTGAAVFIVLAVYFLFLSGKASKKLTDIMRQRNMSFTYSNGIMEQIENASTSLQRKYSSVGASSMEDYLSLKTEFDKKSIQAEGIRNDIKHISANIEENQKRISSLKENILGKLTLTGTLETAASEISQENINEFKTGIRKYKGLEPTSNYTSKRKEDISTLSENLINKLKNSYNITFENEEQLSAIITSSSAEIRELEGKSHQKLDQIVSMSLNKGIPIFGLEVIGDELTVEKLSEVEVLACTSAEKAASDLEKLNLEIRELETVIKSQDISSDKNQQLEEEIYELESKKSQLEDTGIALRLALETLDEASYEIQRDFVPVLNLRMSNIIDKISSGKYNDIRANDQLMLNTVDRETGGIIPASLVSSGTADQMYLALRLAMADFITADNEKLPLLMDEIFSQFDDLRTAQTLELLKEISTETQVILFTCKERELELAQLKFGDNLNIIEL